MKTLFTIIISSLLFSGLSGCVIVAGDRDWDLNDDNNWQKEQQNNREQISNLELQSSRLKVTELLGSANFSDAFMKGDDQYRVLYYRTQHTKSDGETTKDETTPLVFKNDKLIGWGIDLLSRIK